MKILNDGHIECTDSIWFFRWFCCKPGKYVVTVVLGHWSVTNYDAVVDDFGNLVRVET